MRAIPTQIIEALQADALTACRLVRMDIDGEALCYTDSDVPVGTGGELYEPRGMAIEPIRYAAKMVVDAVGLELDNIDGRFTPVFGGGTPQGSSVLLQAALFGEDNAILGLVPMFEGYIDSWGLDEATLTLSVANILSRFRDKTLNYQSASCRWKRFKGPECAYTGDEDWCDRTYDRCVALGNEANFGGFPFLPSLADKQVWWGRQPK